MAEILESKRLACHINEHYDQYVTGELDMNNTLDQTDKIFIQGLLDPKKKNSSCLMIHDSNLMKTQTRLARQRARYYKPDSLVFNPVEFSNKLSSGIMLACGIVDLKKTLPEGNKETSV